MNEDDNYDDNLLKDATDIVLKSEEYMFSLSTDYGCNHYLRRCKIVSPCCGKVFQCRLCHDETMDDDPTPIKEMHKIDRFKISKIICDNCEKEQDIGQYCKYCGICFGKYFCNICKLFDDGNKEVFHCIKCGFCRIGTKEKNYHCDKCDCCILVEFKDSHNCINRGKDGMRTAKCPVCMESTFDSVIPITIPKCGHNIHERCLLNLLSNGDFKCPYCSKSFINLDEYNKRVDEEIEGTEMPEEFKDKYVQILCNECEKKSNVNYHFIGHKCPECGSYNTKIIS